MIKHFFNPREALCKTYYDVFEYLGLKFNAEEYLRFEGGSIDDYFDHIGLQTKLRSSVKALKKINYKNNYILIIPNYALMNLDGFSVILSNADESDIRGILQYYNIGKFEQVLSRNNIQKNHPYRV